MNYLTNILIERLEEKGMELSLIHGFVRDLANTISVSPHLNLFQVKRQLDLLGWDGFELDYHTLQLALACFEAEGLKGLENRKACGLEDNFKPQEGRGTERPNRLKAVLA